MLTICAIEVTNVCNLRCSHCPVGTQPFHPNTLPLWTDGVNYPKGYISVEIFQQALQYAKQTVGLNLHGEPLLHPQICDLIDIAKKSGKTPVISTNGLLLTEVMSQKLIESGITSVEVSIHTPKSLNGFKNIFDANETAGNPISVIGHVVSCNLPKLREWVNNTKIEKKYLEKTFLFDTHNWLRNSPGEDMSPNCVYLNNELCDVKWDGRVIACCFDFEGRNDLGHLDDFPNLQHKRYELCKCCSPTWVQGHTFNMAPVLWNEYLWP